MPRVLAVAVLLALLPAAAHAATARPAGAGCDRFDDTACLLPFPNDKFTKLDRSTGTGRVLDFRAAQMPRNAKGVPIDPSQFRGMDGFSPGSTILTRVRGLDAAGLRRSGAVSLSDLSAYTKAAAPVLVLDLRTARRWPVWAEVGEGGLLQIHPARNFADGGRYVVVLRGLRRKDGSRIRAGARFARLRDARRVRDVRYDRIFKVLKKAKVRRDDSLFLTWDFTVASERSLTERMLHLRDEAFAQLGDPDTGDRVVEGRAPTFTLAEKALDGDDAKYQGRFARVLEGTVEVPCYLDSPSCGPGGAFRLNSRGIPDQGEDFRARFLCVVPDTATAATPARMLLYGHGLLGSEREVLTNPDIPLFAREANAVLCATPWLGMSSEDIPNAASVLGDFSKMDTIADRLQQGMLAALLLGRAMIHSEGLATSPLLQQDGRPIVQPGFLGYDGNSQGGIMGGALTAYAPDYEHAVLGVPGMNYGVLLPRSVDWDVYAQVFRPAYKDVAERPLVLALAQVLWDRGEADGVANHIASDPLEATPSHEVLLHVAFGDHQVTQYQADVLARTVGARIHTPILAAGRSPQRKPSWGIPAIPAGAPWGGSAIVYWDSGPQVVGPPPLGPEPNRSGQDPHEHPRRTPAARQQKAAFLAPGGTVVDACGGAACLGKPDVG
ncbi:MAG: hypothetical protein HZB46_17185 [Solirubrobacterales bacterium]|nr:hypothetical protein [Solirubrobacterales bacterium]